MEVNEQIPRGWSLLPFQEAIDFQEGPGILAKDFRPSGVPLIRLSGLDRGGRVLDGCDFLDEETVRKRWNHFRVLPGDVLLSTSASLGRIAIVDKESAGAVPYTGIIRMRPLHQSMHAAFIPFLLESPHFQTQVEAMGVGSVIRHFGPSHLRQMSVLLPDRTSQQAIAHILGSLDDKIDQNRRINETLEAMARALFKSWFVNFDPVRARATERQPVSMDEDAAKLFPTEFADSELGQIPKGWHIGSILGSAHLLSGGTPKTDNAEYWSGEIAWASAKDVSQCGGTFLVLTERTITTRGLAESATQLIPDFSTVVVARGATTGRMVLLGREMAMNQTCYALTSTNRSPFFLYLLMRHAVDALVHGAHGSVFDTITTTTFAASRVVTPTPDVVRAFEAVVAPLLRSILHHTEESGSLTLLRDSLLPRLLSGELSVRGAERAIEATA